MKFDFDTFEFVGLIAPGSVIVLIAAFLHPNLIHLGDLASITFAVVAAYIVGHLVAAIGNLAELCVRRYRRYLPEWFKVPSLASLEVENWQARGYLAADQTESLHKLLQERLGRNLGCTDSIQRHTVVKQMHLWVIRSGDAQRADTFNGLYNLSRGMAISFIIAAVLSIIAGRYWAALMIAVAVFLALFRTRKFRGKYSEELVQQFLLPDNSSQGRV